LGDCYNLIAIPVAAGLFVRWRIDLPMGVGAIAMSTSSLIQRQSKLLAKSFFKWPGKALPQKK
jgi:cation transport ATPase